MDGFTWSGSGINAVDERTKIIEKKSVINMNPAQQLLLCCVS